MFIVMRVVTISEEVSFMRVSTQFTIAVHALIMIAYFPDIRVTSEMVAESVGNNPVIIRNIYGKLKKAGILSIQRGMRLLYGTFIKQ